MDHNEILVGVNTRSWVNSAQDKDYWRALVNSALNLRFSEAMELVQPPGKELLGRFRRRWENNIIMNLKEIGINTGNCVDAAQDRHYWKVLVDAILNLWVP